jgi:pimeloyl-ACP methyl ester carboxylesterase
MKLARIGARSPKTELALFVIFVSACATPIGVKHLDQQAAQRELNANVLSTGGPSAFSTRYVERTARAESFATDQQATLAKILSGLGGPDEPDRLFALAELSLGYAEASGDQAYYLASAVYAYAFLFPKDPGAAPDAYDPRLRLAVDLYNQGITSGLATKNGSELDLSKRRLELPFGSLELAAAPAGFRYGGYQLTQFVPLADLEVRGLRDRYRRPGIGAALAAQAKATQQNTANQWIPPNAKVPVTAFVRFDDPRRAMSDGKVRGTIELYDVDAVPAVQVGGYSVPLESEPTVELAYRLEGSPIWDFEIAGFRRGDFSFLDPGRLGEGNGLFMLHPYFPGRIPVVFVHGTASSPARWAEMANELLGDPAISSHYQFWYFIYNSGNPIALSSMRLREALQAVHKGVDPSGKDLALQQMVVIGHSQGGLLTKMTVVKSGSQFWDARMKIPFENAELDPETRDLLRRALFVEPLPYVTRVVFICTPHRGSFLASNFVVKIGNKLVSLPGGLAKAAAGLTKLQESSALGTPFTIPTALDNMNASNPFVKTLSALPIAAGVHAHSIIAVKGDGPVAAGNDGVVEYQSAHIDGVESELVVHSSHSAQGEPATIEEVRRILYEHAGIH